jgi:hypothetical protein
LKEERKEKKISHPNRFVDAPTKNNSQKNSIMEGSEGCLFCLLRGDLPNHGTPHCAFGIGKKPFDE